MLEVFGYIIYCVITIWVCAMSVFVTMFDSGANGKLTFESGFFLGVAGLFVFGAYKLWPFNPLTLVS